MEVNRVFSQSGAPRAASVGATQVLRAGTTTDRPKGQHARTCLKCDKSYMMHREATLRYLGQLEVCHRDSETPQQAQVALACYTDACRYQLSPQ